MASGGQNISQNPRFGNALFVRTGTGVKKSMCIRAHLWL
jgi:hypothetical protein